MPFDSYVCVEHHASYASPEKGLYPFHLGINVRDTHLHCVEDLQVHKGNVSGKNTAFLTVLRLSHNSDLYFIRAVRLKVYCGSCGKCRSGCMPTLFMLPLHKSILTGMMC